MNNRPVAIRGNGHGEKIFRLRGPAIMALLTEPTMERAAKKLGIGVMTLKRWTEKTRFCRRVRKSEEASV